MEGLRATVGVCGSSKVHGQILATVLKMEPTEALGRQAFLQVVRTRDTTASERRLLARPTPSASVEPLQEAGRSGAQAGSQLSPQAQSYVGLWPGVPSPESLCAGRGFLALFSACSPAGVSQVTW